MKLSFYDRYKLNIINLTIPKTFCVEIEQFFNKKPQDTLDLIYI